MKNFLNPLFMPVLLLSTALFLTACGTDSNSAQEDSSEVQISFTSVQNILCLFSFERFCPDKTGGACINDPNRPPEDRLVLQGKYPLCLRPGDSVTVDKIRPGKIALDALQ